MDASLRRLVGPLLIALVLWLVYYLRGVLSPIVAGLFLAYLLSPVRHALVRRKVPGALASLLALGALSVGLLGFLLLFLPPAIADFTALAARLPGWLEQLSDRVEAALGVELPASSRELWDQLKLWQDSLPDMTQATGKTLSSAGWLLSATLGQGLVLLSIVGKVVLTPIFAFYFLEDFELLMSRAGAAIPPHMKGITLRAAKEIDGMMSGFLRGQLTVCAVLAAIYAVLLGVLGVRFGVFIGLLAGLSNFIPYAGLAIGLVLSLVSVLLEGGSTTMFVLVPLVFLVVGVVDALFVTPVLLGGKVGLSPAYVIASVLVFGNVFGFVGVLLAVPLMSAAKILARLAFEGYQRHILEVG